MAARALFAFHHGEDAEPTERQMVGALLESEKIDCLRILAKIETERVKAQARASRKKR